MNRNYNEIYKDIKINGFFSEYLPPCFSLNEKVFRKIPEEKCDLVKPYSFTMSRFNLNDSRRTIFIPEIGAYAVLNNFIKENKILEELIEFIDNYSESFSKFIMEDGSIMKHEQSYDVNLLESDRTSSRYIDNIVKKIIKSAGAKKILKLDISSCFSSVYTHYIPAILLGYNDAEGNYKRLLKNEDEDIDEKYNKYKKLDDIIRKQNTNQTNGLLVGPIFSQLIVEGLLTRIDIELKEKKILFSRYVDDYEVYLFDESQDEIISIFVSILKKYGLSLNFEKIQLLDFPYYVVENFDRIITVYRENNIEDYDLMKLFNDFFEIEKSGTKGAIRYLIKNIDSEGINIGNKRLFGAYIINIMMNNPRSLTKACSLIINNDSDQEISENYIHCIKNMLFNNLKKGFDLEVIWLLYVLIETNNITEDDDIIEYILNSDNELAMVMILRKKLTNKIDIIKEKAKSWILNYELFVDNYINDNELGERMLLNKNMSMYENLKNQNFHFCY